MIVYEIYNNKVNVVGEESFIDCEVLIIKRG